MKKYYKYLCVFLLILFCGTVHQAQAQFSPSSYTVNANATGGTYEFLVYSTAGSFSVTQLVKEYGDDIVVNSYSSSYIPDGGDVSRHIFTIHLGGHTNGFEIDATYTVNTSIGTFELFIRQAAHQSALVPGSLTPSSQTIVSGTSPSTMTHTGFSGGTGSYNRQWQYSSNGSAWYNVPGATGTNYKPGNLYITTHYRILVDNSTYTSTATVTVTPPTLVPGSLTPSAQTINSGGTPNISHSGISGGTGSYSNTWYYKLSTDPDADANWTQSTGLMPLTNETFSNIIYQFKRRVYSGTQIAETNTVNVTVRPAVPALVPGSLTPSTQTINSGATPNISHSGTSGGTGVYTYQWQRKAPGSSSWTNVSSVSTTLTNTGTSAVTYQFKRIVTSGSQTKETNIVSVTVNPGIIEPDPPLVLGSIIPSSQTIDSGNTPTTMELMPLPSGGNGNYNYQWYSNPSGSSNGTRIDGANAISYNPGTLTNTGTSAVTRTYRLVVTSGYQIGYKQASITVNPEGSTDPDPDPTLVVGSISPEQQSIGSGDTPGRLELSPCAGGNNSYSYEWQLSTDGVSFSPIIPAATGNSYQPETPVNEGGSPIVYHYRVFVGSGNQTGTSAAATITVRPDGESNPNGRVIPSQTIAIGTKPQQLSIYGISWGSSTYTYQWQHSTDGINYTDITGVTAETYQPGVLNQGMLYRVMVTCNEEERPTLPARITVWNPVDVTANPSASQNYILRHTFIQPLSSAPSNITTAQAMPSITYYDGLGRPVQTVEVGASPLKRDIITPVEYDAAGRADARQYLSYLPEGASNRGAYIPDALAAQTDYYTGVFGDNDGIRAFVENIYPQSPLNRPTAQHKTGDVYENRPVTYGYMTNTANEVLKLEMQPNDGFLVNGYYPANSLYKTGATNEDGLEMYVFSDKLGRKLLERSTDGTTTMDTYYVYDERRLLRWVIQPEGAKPTILRLGTTLTISNHYMMGVTTFFYRYDDRGRQVMKRLPVADSVLMVYDNADRLVARQTGNDRQKNRWIMNAYDNHGRMTGEREVRGTYTAAQVKSQYQTLYDNGYVLLAYEYDQYASGSTLASTTSEGGITLTYDKQRMRGLMTYNKTAILEHYYENYPQDRSMIERRLYYDTKGRLIQTVEAGRWGNMANRFSQEYDFMGNILASHERLEFPHGSRNYQVLKEKEVDHRNRLISQETTFTQGLYSSGTAQVDYMYNELGQLQQKVLGGDNPVSNPTYAYNIQGWLADQQSEHFAMKLDYFNAGKYAGNISQWEYLYPAATSFDSGWRTQEFQYDPFNRLISSIEFSPQISAAIGRKENLTYDLNGNITSLIQKRSREANSYTERKGYSYYGNLLSNLTHNKDGSAWQDQMSYDRNGNLQYRSWVIEGFTPDVHFFEYNYLNLPQRISLWPEGSENESSEERARYTYAADGTKLESGLPNFRCKKS